MLVCFILFLKHLCSVWGAEDNLRESLLSSHRVVLQIKFRLAGVAANAVTCQAASPAHSFLLVCFVLSVCLLFCLFETAPLIDLDSSSRLGWLGRDHIRGPHLSIFLALGLQACLYAWFFLHRFWAVGVEPRSSCLQEQPSYNPRLRSRSLAPALR